ncbi:hypothetical protein Z517_09216 [Fonsecaea pedrosoi CBS 271.37]|uniref:Uncharacterized protein n=1 Tax=Fonsecaea pedrosoi CBS 271.37 TaxID=1442368 RepID=A0A0D2ER86_9EURO|nr:uncharacterized protein Z517_09216 [Fonsecaea pedrosoi CBS 271.37]KIW76772.1 hypothetical protein Z517_09216 [Fonsecaea pedrosoi CBS 271.37]
MTDLSAITNREDRSRESMDTHHRSLELRSYPAKYPEQSSNSNDEEEPQLFQHEVDVQHFPYTRDLPPLNSTAVQNANDVHGRSSGYDDYPPPEPYWLQRGAEELQLSRPVAG